MNETQTRHFFNLPAKSILHESMHMSLLAGFVKCLTLDLPDEVKKAGPRTFAAKLSFSNKIPFIFNIAGHTKQYYEIEAKLKEETNYLYGDILDGSSY